MSDRPILLGVIGRPHGVRGFLHVHSYTADPADLTAYGPLDDGKGRKFRLRWQGEGVQETAVVAERALDLGATIVNDISALTYDTALAGVIARRGAAVVLMHNRGRSADMYALAEYGVDHVDMPASQEKLWRLITAGKPS